MNIIIAILIFGIIIIVHELGHFSVAKKNGIRVDEFCIGLGPTLFGKQVGETYYSVKLLPFGGACMMGEDEDRPEADAFGNKSVWARMAVIFAGPFFNFVFALILAFIMIGISGADLSDIARVETKSPAQEAGLKAGDQVLKIDGKKIYNNRELSYYFLLDYKGGEVPIVIKRDGTEKSLSVTPKFNQEAKRYMIGIGWEPYQKLNPLKTIEYGFHEVGFQIRVTVKSVVKLATGQLTLNDLSGPVGIVKQVGDTYNQAATYGFTVLLSTMLSIAVLISANLGVMNLLPLPALDGGRLCFLIVEAVRRKPVSKNVEAAVHTVGLFLLLGLMIFVMFQDIYKIML